LFFTCLTPWANAASAKSTGTGATETTPAPPAVDAGAWQLSGRHLIVGMERMATVAVWRDVEGDYETDSPGSKTWGVEAALLTANSTRKSLSEPRLGLDYVTARGFTLGMALGYVQTGGKHGRPNERLILLAPRVGVFRALGPRLAVWVRVGFTYWSARSRRENHDQVPHGPDWYDDELSEPPPPWVTETWTTTNFSLEPQLLFCLVPRVAVSAAVFAEPSLSGTRVLDYHTKFSPYSWSWSTSSYGLSAGLTAIF